MEYLRILDLNKLLKDKSFFLFGPRATGKSTLIHTQLGDEALILDLLRNNLLMRLSDRPSDLEDLIAAAHPHPKVVVIDEIQKVPVLLNEVHRLIETQKLKFLLTGSSARALRRGGTNLLAGRAWIAHLFPLCSQEIPDFNLDRYLRYGGLPSVYKNEKPQEELDAYVQTYLREEVLAEGIIRKLPPFARFLKVAALSNGTQVNLTQVGSDAQVSPSTVREYFSVLEDTLVGFYLEPWTSSKKRKASMTAKFYFFDTGVTHTLASTTALDRNSNLYGTSFEQFIGMEIRAYLDYKRLKLPLTFWRTTHGVEVDYLMGEDIAVEVKSTTRVSRGDTDGLKTLQEEGVFKQFILVTQDPLETRRDNITVLHWQTFLKRLWGDQLLTF